jgi:hypothetical protein
MAKEDDVSKVEFESMLISPPYVARRGSIAEWQSHAKSKYDALGGVGPNVNHQVNNER